MVDVTHDAQACASHSGTPPSAPSRSPLAALAAGLLHKRLKASCSTYQCIFQAMIDDPTQRSLQTLADPVQIKVQDGRVLVGDFACMDKQGNIILYNAVEELLVDGA